MIPRELQALGVVHEYLPNSPVFPAITMNLMGRKSRGKTHVAFTAPGPIVYVAFDPGQEGVRTKFQGKKQIMAYFPKEGIVPLGTEPTQAMAAEVLKRFFAIYKQCFELGPPHVRTLVVDQGNQFANYILMAMYGRVSKILPLQYGPYYDYLKKAVNYPHEGARKPVNVIWTHPMKDEYEKTDDDDKMGKKTGQDVMRGYADFGYEVDIEVLLERPVLPGLILGDFTGKITKSRYDPTKENQVLSKDHLGSQLDFARIANWIFPEAEQAFPGCWNTGWVPPAGAF